MAFTLNLADGFIDDYTGPVDFSGNEISIGKNIGISFELISHEYKHVADIYVRLHKNGEVIESIREEGAASDRYDNIREARAAAKELINDSWDLLED